jgi:RHS repeat-associated protein
MPFGEEIIGLGNRTSQQGYSVNDNVRQKFTQKERDNETGLDYFLARYYSPTLARFTSPDEFKGGPEELFGEVDPHDPLFYSEIAEPQSLNKYQYCLNNPLRYIDPDGHQTATADALKAGATLVVAAPHPVAKGIGVAIIVGVVVEKTVGWENVGKAAAGAVKWFGSGNTAGDGSCQGCTSSQQMGQSLMSSSSNSSNQNGSNGQSSQQSQSQSSSQSSSSGSNKGKGKDTKDKQDVRDSKKAGDLISGSLKKSKSYHSGLAGKTYKEIKSMAKEGDKAAQQMKKLIEQGERLRNKVKNK